MSEEVARCPHCGSLSGGTAAALDALYGEVAKIRAVALEEAAAREADLLREVRLLQQTVARLRGGLVRRDCAAESLRDADLTSCFHARQ